MFLSLKAQLSSCDLLYKMSTMWLVFVKEKIPPTTHSSTCDRGTEQSVLYDRNQNQSLTKICHHCLNKELLKIKYSM